jgi:tetratricopeptide (TPR) repeat protein
MDPLALPNCDTVFEYLSGDVDAAALHTHARSCSACHQLIRESAPQLDPYAALVRAISQDPRFENLPALERIILACERCLDTQPVRAEVLSGGGCSIADALHVAQAVPLQVIMWTRRAAALRGVGRLGDAAFAIEVAEERARRLPIPDMDLALVGFTAAHILREQGSYAEALARVTSARDVFERYRDGRRTELAQELEASIRYRLGEFEDSYHIFTTLLARRDTSDLDGRARLALSAAHAAVVTGRYDASEELYLAAHQSFEKLGFIPHVLRAEWGLARLAFARGQDEQGFELLHRVRDQFAVQSMIPEWIRAGIELAEHLLRVEEFTEVTEIAEEVYLAARTASMVPNALDALAYFREAARRDVLSPEGARYVREYVEHAAVAPPFALSVA